MGDRFDGRYIKDSDGMHYITPFIYPNRCDNEAFFSFQVDLSRLDEYLQEKNAGDPDYKYNLFQCIITSVLKTITLRSRLSIFIHNRRLYRRNEVSASFVVKQEFADDGNEVLAFIHSKPEWNIDDVHDEIRRQLLILKDKNYTDDSSGFMDKFRKMPEFISRPLLNFVCWLEKKGKLPSFLISTDPYHASVIFANLGSIGLPEGYHHLTNWGTTSLFVVVGQSGRMPFFENDEIVFKNAVRLGITLDERIADGYYFSKSIAMMKYFLEHPQTLEEPLNQKMSDEVWQTLRFD